MKRFTTATMVAQLLVSCGGPGCGGATSPGSTVATAQPDANGATNAPQTGADGIPGTRVRLALPAGFQRVPHLGLFANESTGTAVLVAEVDSDDATFLNELTQGALKNYEGGEPTRTKTTRSGSVAEAFEGPGLRGIAVAEPHAQWIVFAFFVEEAESAVAESIVSSAHFDASAKYDAIEAMGLELSVDPKLELHGSSGALLFLEAGAKPPREASLFVYRFPEVMDFKTAMTNILASTPGLHLDRKSAKLEQVLVDDLQGAEFVADGAFARPTGGDVSVATKKLMTLYLMTLSDDWGTFVLHGKVDRARKTEWLPRLRRMARSLKRRR